MDNFDGYTAQLSHVDYMNLHLCTLAREICVWHWVLVEQLLAVESLWEQSLCASPFEGKWISKVWAKNHLGCMSVSLSLYLSYNL